MSGRDALVRSIDEEILGDGAETLRDRGKDENRAEVSCRDLVLAGKFFLLASASRFQYSLLVYNWRGCRAGT